MKKYLLILSALLLTAVGASAQTTDFTSRMINTQAYWTNASGTYSGGIERYANEAYGAGKVLYQQIANLPAGTYSVTFYAVANSTGSRDAITNDAYGENIAQVFANSTTQNVTVVQQTACTPSNNSYTLECTVGDDGILEYGLQNIATGGNWYVCQGVSLTLTTDIVTRTLVAGDVIEECEAEFNHWTISGNTSGLFQRNTWSTEADASGMKTPFIEYWIGAGTDLAAATISHNQIMGLPQGYYTVSIFARAFDEATTGATSAAEDITEGDMFFTANDVEIDLATGTHGLYNDYSREVYGTYELIAYVDANGTLDIGFTLIGDSEDGENKENCDWLAFKNLKVEYLGTTLAYEINEPECSAKVVQPGDEVSIVYECITPDTDETPAPDTSKSIMVGTATVTLDENALDCKGYSATVTFTIPEITVGEDITISVPEGLIYWEVTEGSNVLSPAATFTVHTPATITDGDYLIMNSDGNYLGGGLAWGTQAATIGKPQFITFGKQEGGTYYHLDSHQTNGGENHYLSSGLYFDAAADDWTLVSIDDGYALYYAGADSYVKDNGFQVAATLSDEPTVWTLVTKDEIIAKMDSATVDNPVDVSALIPSCEPKRNAWGDVQTTGAWTATGYNVAAVPQNYSFGQNGNVASCAESYISTNGFDIRQSVTFPKKGVYVLSAQAFHGSSDDAPVMYVSSSDATSISDGNSVALPMQGETSANNMVTAYQEFLEELHPVSLQFTVDADETTLYVGFSSVATSSSGWNIFGELGLQYLGVAEETVEWEMTTANWGTLILPFAVAADEVPTDLTIYNCTGTETDEETQTTTVTVTEVEDGIAANTPYLVKGNVEQDTNYTFTGTPVEATGALTAGLLTGTFETLTYTELSALTGTVYLLQNHTGEGEEGVAFYPVTSESTGATLTANHCYLTLSSSSGVRAYIGFPDSGEATAIVAVEGAEAECNGAIYDLSGRRVSKAVKGVYIQNGKKVLVK